MMMHRTLPLYALAAMLALAGASSADAETARTKRNKRNAQDYCEQREREGVPCKISPTAGCGVGWKKAHRFRDGGNAWYACTKNGYGRASDGNRRECEAWCRDHAECEKCSDRVGCGPGYRSAKTFGGRGENWHACEKTAYRRGSEDNQSECEAWCRNHAECEKCSDKVGCGPGYRSAKTFGGRGENWHACEKTAYRRGSENNRRECETWCSDNELTCEKCSDKATCGRGYRPVKTFGGRGENWYACDPWWAQNKESCETWCGRHAECVKCSPGVGCGVGYESIRSFDDSETYTSTMTGILETIVDTIDGSKWYACRER